MPATNRIASGRARPADIADELRKLDPDTDYSFVIRPVRAGDEIAAEMETVFAQQVADPSLKGKSEDEVLEIIDDEVAALRATNASH